MDKPRTEAVTFSEGGDWITPADDAFFSGRPVHSILFSDGSEWDVVNGWRSAERVAASRTTQRTMWVFGNG